MEEELSRIHISPTGDENTGSLLEDEEFTRQEPSYVHISPLPEDDDYESQEWTDGSSEKCNLIVNYLPHEIDDVTLKTMFAEHGDIAVAKVVKDKSSKKSLGYGFVKFVREEDAVSAIEAKNGFLMGHKKLKVSLARPPSTEIRNCKLYITNLPKEFTEKDVVELFSQFGEIIECRVLRDRNSKSNKGVAFVQFNLRVQANNALSLNGYRPPHCDRHLMVKYAEDQHKKKDRRSQVAGGPMGLNMMENLNMMDGQLKPDSRDPYLYSRVRMQPGMYRPQQPHMQINQMGMNHSANQTFLPPSAANYPLRGSGKGSPSSMSPSSISNMSSSGEWYNQGQGQMFQMLYDNQMGNPQSHMHNQSLSYDQHAMAQGHRSSQSQSQGLSVPYMRASRSTSDPSYNGAVTIIVSFLPQHADVALLHDLCSPYGRIISAQLDVDTSNSNSPDESVGIGGCTGRGRVQMASLSQAQYATQALNGAIIFEGGRPLQVSIAFGGVTKPISDLKKAAVGR